MLVRVRLVKAHLSSATWSDDPCRRSQIPRLTGSFAGGGFFNSKTVVLSATALSPDFDICVLDRYC